MSTYISISQIRFQAQASLRPSRFGQTFIIVTHDEELASITDRTIHLRDGLIVEPEGPSVEQEEGPVAEQESPIVEQDDPIIEQEA